MARNVVAGCRARGRELSLPPRHGACEAEQRLRAHLATADEIELIGPRALGAVTIASPLAQQLIAATGQQPTPKQAWTPVAEFTAAGR